MENNNNNKTTVWVVVIIIILLIAGAFYLSYRARNKAQESAANSQTQETNQTSVSAPAVSTIVAKHQYKNGQHTYAGSIDLPTPCDSLAVQAVASSSAYVLSFATTRTGDLCAQVITTRTFKVSFPAAKTVKVTATFNGQPVRLNVVEVPANQDLDSFKIDIKG